MMKRKDMYIVLSSPKEETATTPYMHVSRQRHAPVCRTGRTPTLTSFAASFAFFKNIFSETFFTTLRFKIYPKLI